MAKKLINPNELYDGAAFGMSQAVVEYSRGLVFVSGQVDWNHDHQVSQGTVAGQLNNDLRNLRIALDAADATVEILLHVRLNIRGELEDHMETVAPILADLLGSSRPTVSGIGVASLASKATLVEVEAIAKTK